MAALQSSVGELTFDIVEMLWSNLTNMVELRLSYKPYVPEKYNDLEFRLTCFYPWVSHL